MSGHIYYIACRETMRLKIGFTRGNPEARLKALQTGSPTDLLVIEVHPGTLEDERRLHEKFADKRLRGEWFQMDEELFEHICLIVWLNAKDCLARGVAVPDRTLLGLEMMYDHIGSLPPELASLIDREAE